ncbi:MAG: HD family phosphohydrolase [Pseudomonadota bacterium]
MTSVTSSQCAVLYNAVKQLYADSPFLPFHGWHHIEFVYKKAAVFAADLKADIPFTQSCALVHDMNYLARPGAYSPPAAGKTLRQEILSKSGFDQDHIDQIETVVVTAETAVRDAEISLEAMALADADTLFKVLPTTPILFTSRFMDQNNYNIGRLAQKIVAEQQPLIAQDIYFYSALAKDRYMGWARTHLHLWQAVQGSLADPDIAEMLKDAGFNEDF